MGKKLGKIHRYLKVTAILAGIAGILLSLFRFLPREDIPVRISPEGLNQTEITARFLESEGVLAVSQTMEIANRSGDTWPDVMLQLPANAYSSAALSPAASEEWFDLSYPEGFSSGALTIDWAGAGGSRLTPEFRSDEHTACFLPVSVPAGGTVTVLLRYRLFLPHCLHRFGQDDQCLRLFRVFPASGVWQDGHWRQDEISPVGDGWNAPLTVFSFEIELPQGCALAAGCEVKQNGLIHSGSLPAADDLCLAVYRKPVRRFLTAAGGSRLTVWAEDAALVREASGLFAPYLRRLSGLYGPSPLTDITVCLLPYYNAADVFPGMIVLGTEQFSRLKRSGADIAWLLASQWFRAGFSTDGFREHWLTSALSEWAGQQAILLENGRDALEMRRKTFVDEAMRENLHLPLTPGTPLSGFPDENTLYTVTRGRGCAFLIAADTLSGGRMNEFLRALLETCCYQRLTEQLFLEKLNRFFSLDFTPLLNDYIHTLI